MTPILKNIIAIIIAIVLGFAINMGVLMISINLLTYPDNFIFGDTDSLNENIHLFEFRHFFVVYLAHTLGTFISAFTVVKLAASRHFILAISFGTLFLMLGLIMSLQIPQSPTWFVIIDLIFAYLPVAWLAYRLAAPKPED